MASQGLTALVKEVCDSIIRVKNIDLRNLGIKDVVVIIGSVYSTGKVVYAVWTMYKTLKEYGLARMMKPNFQKYGRWAIVTGCTHGIGKGYATELAESGLNIVLVSRNPDKLQEMAQYLESTYGVETDCIAVDFNEGSAVYDIIEKGIGSKEIGILVNNVGVMYDFPQYFADVPEEKLWQLINVNIAAATMLTHMVLPQMVSRKKGAVVIVASGTSFLPTPLATVYAASKKYLDYFARALNYEYKPQGITVQCLKPFFVASGSTHDLLRPSAANLLVPSAENYAHQAAYTLGWTDNTTGCLSHTMQSWLAGLLPEGMWIWSMALLNSSWHRSAKQQL